MPAASLAVAVLLASAPVAQPPIVTHVNALLLWDPDGAGDRAPQLVVAGDSAGRRNPLAGRVALYDPATGYWADLERGVDGSVAALAVLPGNDLVVGGEFDRAGGVPAPRVARWDGERWHPFGVGVGDGPCRSVRALAVGLDGALFAGGKFEFAGSVRAVNVAVWRGGEWRDLGLGVEDGVLALAIAADGALIAAGGFEAAGDARIDGIARWDGTAWSGLDIGIDGAVSALLPLSRGGLLAAGAFDHAGGERAENVARWRRGRWSPLAGGYDGHAMGLARLPGGDLVVAGDAGVWRWDGSAWYEVGELRHTVRVLVALPDGTLIAGGAGLYHWQGGDWVTVLRAQR